MKRIFKFLFLLSIGFIMSTSITSCTERVDPGFVGMVQTVDGLQPEVLQPGNHSCYGRDKLVLVENAESNFSSNMSVLCKDELNFKFKVNILARLKNVPGQAFDKQIADVLERQGGKIEWKNGSIGILNFGKLYNTYVAKQVDGISRSVVGKYNTTDIRQNRDMIEASILKELRISTENTPIEIVTVITSNFDYPPVITKAQEAAKEREIELKQEDAKQALKLKKMTNREIIADKAIIVRAKEAKAEAIYVRILGTALNKDYLQLKAIENQKLLYNNKTNRTVIVPEGSTPFISTK